MPWVAIGRTSPLSGRCAHATFATGGIYDIYLVGSARHHGPAHALFHETGRGKAIKRIMQKLDPSERHSATALDILGRNGRAAPTVDPRWGKNWERLHELREHLGERRSAQIHNDSPNAGQGNFASNLADRGTDEYDMGAALGLISSEQNALYEIDQAIQRIRDGTYGICETTGKEIPANRLEAIPWTRFVSEVEEILEREEAGRKPRHIL